MENPITDYNATTLTIYVLVMSFLIPWAWNVGGSIGTALGNRTVEWLKSIIL